eukprot:33983-Eustigmatos_ZCMA.PRE.1
MSRRGVPEAIEFMRIKARHDQERRAFVKAHPLPSYNDMKTKLAEHMPELSYCFDIKLYGLVKAIYKTAGLDEGTIK